MRNLSFIGTLVVSITILSSCATMFSGTKANMKITSNPPELKVYSINKEQQLTEIGVTPCIVTINKKTPYLIIKSEGYYDEKYDIRANAKVEPTYWLNAFNLFVVGPLVDIVSGAYIKPQQEVAFEMKKKYDTKKKIKK
jgi:hypothetical protein